LNYNEKNLNHSPLGIIDIILFFAIILIIEIFYRIYLSRPYKPHKIPDATLTPDEFNRKVREEKQMLVILDELVLDVTEYMENHPGGKFLLEHNKGRDISKYFYGGYGLDGNLVYKGAKPHTHSNIARAIVESLSVARLVHNKN
jgi:cytochrome b involved in lipid metabolism